MRRRAAGLMLGAAASILAMAPGHASADNYGAIAYSPSTKANGYSYDYPSRAAAENNAMSRCDAEDCKIVMWFREACGAVAAGADGYGASWASTRSQAEAKAIAECGKYTSGCATAVWTCTTR